MSAKFATVFIDVDSTLSGIEGIDWLAERRGPEVSAKIMQLTDDAMRGVRPLESVYGARLDTIRPTLRDIEALGEAYIEKIAVGSADAIRRMRDAGVHLVLISGGIRQAIRPLADLLDFAAIDFNAVDLSFDAAGNYVRFDAASPLATSHGKRTIIEQLQLPRPSLGVGDGATDVVMREVTDQFGAYVGFARRENVVARADIVVASFSDLATLVLGS